MILKTGMAYRLPVEEPEDAYASCDGVTATDDGFNSGPNYHCYNSSNPLDNFEPESLYNFKPEPLGDLMTG
ncbi:MAG: hypothetical protein ACI93R_001597 [Flavobacteriales bacterium]|jgi:hypothetical protein